MSQASFRNSYISAMAFIAALGGYMFGFDFAVISGALPFLRAYFSLNAYWEGFLTGSLPLGCIAGCLLAGKLANRYGRRSGLVMTATVFAASSVGMAFSGSLAVFVFMRFIAGIAVGMASMLSPLYIAEISPPVQRARNVAINQLTIVVGILITNLINYKIAGGGPEMWRWMFGLGFVPSLLFLAGALCLPESPRWLIGRGREKDGRIVLEKIGGKEYAQKTIVDGHHTLGTHQQQTSNAVFAKAVMPAVSVGITLAVLQQLCGVNVVFTYTSTIFKAVGSDVNQQLFETVAIGIVNTLYTLLAMWQVNRLGRKPLMLTGSLGLAIVYTALAYLLSNQAPSGWVSLFVLLAIGLYASSLAPVTWAIIFEVFPGHVRGLAISVALVSRWAAYFILVFTFPVLADILGIYGPFYLYAIICLLGFLFILCKVKETSGQTSEHPENNYMIH